jgi:hypothetical protein
MTQAVAILVLIVIPLALSLSWFAFWVIRIVRERRRQDAERARTLKAPGTDE